MLSRSAYRPYFALALSLAAFVTPCLAIDQNIFVIAPSKAARKEAQAVMDHFHWTQVAFTDTHNVLVVVRNAMAEPLGGAYRDMEGLEDDIHAMYSDDGDRFHIYVYRVTSDGSLMQRDHAYKMVHDEGVVEGAMATGGLPVSRLHEKGHRVSS